MDQTLYPTTEKNFMSFSKKHSPETNTFSLIYTGINHFAKNKNKEV